MTTHHGSFQVFSFVIGAQSELHLLALSLILLFNSRPDLGDRKDRLKDAKGDGLVGLPSVKETEPCAEDEQVFKNEQKV